MGVVLGFDTSCYTTSAAAVHEDGRVLLNQRMLLPVELGQRGLRQSEAVFAHVRQMPLLTADMEPILREEKILAVAASSAPTSAEESYMPVFTVGLGHAQVLANILGVPCVKVSHQEGHIAAGQIGRKAMDSRFVALHVSGGTTELLLSQDGKLTRLGGSLDLNAGQLMDRVGVAMGCPFPAGAALERKALACRERAAGLLPASMEGDDLFCHLSGAETKCQGLLKEGALSHERIALEAFDFLARTVARLLMAGCRAADVTLALLVGGVASSTLLRGLVAERLQKAGSKLLAICGEPGYSTDNAAGVALLGLRRYEQMKNK